MVGAIVRQIMPSDCFYVNFSFMLILDMHILITIMLKYHPEIKKRKMSGLSQKKMIY